MDTGVYESVDYMFPSYYIGDAPHVYVAKRMKEDGIKIPIMCSGNHTLETASTSLNDGVLDYVMWGRSLVADPALPNKILKDQIEDIKPCIRCNEYCIKGAATYLGLKCAVNTQAGDEKRNAIIKTSEPKNVVVVGGGSAGLEAAVVAAKKGHNVTLYEKESEVGGLIRAAATPDFKKQLRALIEYYKVQLKKLNVNVVLNKEISGESNELVNADHILVAAGSNVMVPPIEGIEKTIDMLERYIKERMV